MKSKHSKLPWTIVERKTDCGIMYRIGPESLSNLNYGGICLYDDHTTLNPHNEGEQKSNAEFIVNACNSYHKTLDALRSCIDAITYDTDAEAENCKWQLPFNVVYKIKLAIAEAVGVPQPNYPDFGPVKNVYDDLDSGQIEYFSKAKGEL